MALIASGWAGTNFGTAAILPIAVGFVSSAFGTPKFGTTGIATAIHATTFGAATAPPYATPINSTVFGLPNSPYLQTGTVSGIASTALGSPRLNTRCYAATITPNTVVSRAYTATNRTAMASGATSTLFSTPTATGRRSGGLGTLTATGGFSASAFGTPVAAVAQSASVNAIYSTSFGAPTSRGGRVATGFNRTRMGTQHRAVSVIGAKYASGFIVGNFGTPAGAIRDRATAMEPTVRFGTPLLTRSTTC
jgi:hypothetical protein